MPSVRLTNSLIPTLALPSKGNQALYQDKEQRGLAVRVTRAGARSFIVDRNTPRGRIRITLGSCNAITVFEARNRAAHAMAAIGRGLTAAQVAAELIRNDGGIPRGAVTIEQVFLDYLRARKLAPRTAYDYRRLFGMLHSSQKTDSRGPSGYLSDWRKIPIAALTASDIKAKFLSIKSESQANYCMRLMRALFNYAEGAITNADGSPAVTENPTKVLTKAKLWHRQSPKREVIAAHELPVWWAAVQALRQEIARDFLTFLILTGLRLNEGARLTWKDVDLKGQYFTITTTKNRDPHSLPMSDFLYQMLARRYEARATDDVYVFPGEHDGPFGDPKKQIAKVVAASAVKFSAHTLRRTFASIAESLDISAYAVKRLLNHRVPSDVTFHHYTVISVERLRDPMQRITDYVLKAAGAKKGTEVRMLSQVIA